LNLFEFGFEFNRFPPVTGQTGPVNRNRSPAVTGNRLGNKTLLTTRLACNKISRELWQGMYGDLP